MAVADMIAGDCEVTILTGSNDTERNNVRELRLGPLRAAVPLLTRVPTGVLGLRRQVHDLLTHLKPDLVHLQDANLLDPVVPVARLLRIPTLVTLRDLLFVPSFGQGEFDAQGSRRPGWSARATAFLGLVEARRISSWVLPALLPLLYSKPSQQRRLMNDATLLLPVSDYVQQELRRCGVTAPSEVLRLEPLPEWPMQPPRHGEGVRFLCVGRMVEGKGFEVLIEAFSRVRQVRPDARLTIGGHGPQRRALQGRAERLGCADAIEFTGQLPFASLLDQYRNADIVVVPSTHQETTGRVALEAGMAGRPVIAARSGGLVESVGDRGLLVRPGNVEELCGAMLSLSNDGARRLHLARAGREEALRFTPAALRGGVLDLYGRVLEGKFV
jgi:glycosyltransferase involved in cell wall biosynthesis